MKLPSTAIICAYNEENTITNIIKTVCSLNIFNEIIVINDGSKDRTAKRIKKLKEQISFTDIHLSKNRGKGFAMAKGIEMSNNEYLVFIDADLSNFTLGHVKKLLYPVITNNVDMVLGQATNTLIPSHINPFKNLSGQRALKKKDVMPIIKKMETAGYGVETLINMHFKANLKTVAYVNLENLIHPTKFQKTKHHQAIHEFIMEAYQIIKTRLSNLKITTKPNKHPMFNIFSINN